MGQSRTKIAGIIAAAAAIALVGAGCSEDDAKDTVGDATASAGQITETLKSQASDASESASSATEGSETATPSEGESTPSESGSASAEETTIAGQTVAGPILTKYLAAGGPTSPLGDPTGPEEDAPGGGKYQEFTGGIVYWNETTQAHIVWGEIRNAWEAAGGPDGALGYPISDEKEIAGGQQSDFQNGHITYIDGQIEVHQN